MDPVFPRRGCANLLCGKISTENRMKMKEFGRGGRMSPGYATDNYSTISEIKTVHTSQFLQFEKDLILFLPHILHCWENLHTCLIPMSVCGTSGMWCTHEGLTQVLLHIWLLWQQTSLCWCIESIHYLLLILRVFLPEIVNKIFALFVSPTKKAIGDACVYWRALQLSMSKLLLSGFLILCSKKGK